MSRGKWSLPLAIVAFALFPVRAEQAIGGSIQVVSPSKYADREGDSQLTNIPTNGRWQQVFPASDFLSLPAGYLFITQLAYRPDGGLRGPLTASFDNCVYRLSTTAASPPKLSRTFATNVGADETVVFDGAVDASTYNIGPSGGPKQFDTVVSFKTPFEYDPDDGNLLVDFTFSGASLPQSYDFVTWSGPGGEVIGTGNPNSATASIEGGGMVFQFTFVPQLQAGDADQDEDFDQFDLVRVQQTGKYLSGQPATWGEGDWNGAPGGYAGNPPTGDSEFNQLDIVAAQQAAIYLTGTYAGFTAGDAAFTAVPEPSSIFLAALGSACLLLLWRPRGASPKE